MNNAQRWILQLVDQDSFIESQDELSDSQQGLEVITGIATIQGQKIALYAQNTEINRGYMSYAATVKIENIMTVAYQALIPVVALLASPGIDIKNDLDSGIGYTSLISHNIALSGIVPQIAVIMGPTLGAPAYSATLMDLICFNQYRSYLMVTSPPVVKASIGESTTMAELGGATIHTAVTGLADFMSDSVNQQLKDVQWLIQFLPSNYQHKPKCRASNLPTAPMPEIPADPTKPFDINLLLKAVVDNSEYYQFKAGFGRAMICAFAYLDGQPVGILANQSTHLSGAIDSDAAQKSSRFLRICDAYNIPIITFIDVPGFMPGKREEQRGLLKFGAGFCMAMQTTVPRLSLIVRKCYGAAAFLMMQTRAHDGDGVLALKQAQVGVMGQQAIAKVKIVEHDKTTAQTSLDSLALATEKGIVDEIIEKDKIRPKLITYLLNCLSSTLR